MSNTKVPPSGECCSKEDSNIALNHGINYRKATINILYLFEANILLLVVWNSRYKSPFRCVARGPFFTLIGWLFLNIISNKPIEDALLPPLALQQPRDAADRTPCRIKCSILYELLYEEQKHKEI